jgi:ribosome-binding factor A
MDELRTRRVAETMREELSELIRFESSDPRLTDIDVTEVIVSPDCRRADVLVRLPNDAEARGEALAGLDHARHYFRRQLMQRLDIYRMPELRFRPDSETSGSGSIERLARRVRRGRPRD